MTINFAILHSKPKGKKLKYGPWWSPWSLLILRFGCLVRITRSKERNRLGLCKLNKIYYLHSFYFLFWHSFCESNQNSSTICILEVSINLAKLCIAWLYVIEGRSFSLCLCDLHVSSLNQRVFVWYKIKKKKKCGCFVV